MKRIIAAILSVLYLTLSSSAAITVHYCGGYLKSININSEGVSCCCGDINMSKSCCHDKELNLELDIDQQTVSSNNNIPEKLVLISDFNFDTDILQESKIEDQVVDNYNIPPPKLIPIWKTNCSLTYYG
jgi:hypothetical protein